MNGGNHMDMQIEAGNPEAEPLAAAAQVVMAFAEKTAEFYQVSLDQLGQVLVQAMLVAMRMNNPEPEWREAALGACIHAIDNASKPLVQTHGAPNVAQ
jgi:hypothetical protein